MKTILFSNIVGDVFDENAEVSFLPKMKEIISSWGLKRAEVVYIDAPMEGYDNLAVFKNIKKCFSEVLDCKNFHFVGVDCKTPNIHEKNDVVYFLTGGNPLTQREIIKKGKLGQTIKNAKFCIGFCAGAMNLSKYGVLTSDEDFVEPMLYDALGRVDISIEPHFNHEWQKREEPEKYRKRIEELNAFTFQMGEPIYALPDSSLIYIDEKELFKFGEVVIFEKNQPMKWKGKTFEAIVATPGCGKSYLCDKYPNRFVDVDEVRLKLKYVVPEGISRGELEATKGNRPFARRMHSAQYIKALGDLLDRERKAGKLLIAAPHPESFDYFQSRGIKFGYIYADEGMKEELSRRYVQRGNSEALVKEQEELFEFFLEGNKKENRAEIKYAFGKDEYLEDILKKFGLKFD